MHDADARQDLGTKSDVEAVLSLVDVRGLILLDVGCGPGKTSRELHAAGAQVLGLEPNPIQAAENRRQPLPEGLAIGEAGAEALPVDDESVDGLLFFRSLHHVPLDKMELAIREAARVLKRGSGFVCFIEPGIQGTHFPLMQPFHDETAVRNAAQAALDIFAAPLFDERSRYIYRQFPKYCDFAAFAARFASLSFNDVRREEIETDEVRRRFEAGRTGSGEYVFEQPLWLDIFRAPAKA